MKKFFYLALIFISVFIINQCSEPRSQVFNRDVLQSQKFEIDTSKDTLVKTAGGIVVSVKAGSLSSSSGNKVVLTIKEALQLADMIKAGLTTAANGEPLSSGGMFFIEPEDKSVQIVSGLDIFIPADFIEETNLYKGAVTDDGKINWETPEPVKAEGEINKYAKGEELFNMNCIQCHTIGKGTLIGPDLVHITKRRDYYWLEAFTLNSQQFLRECNGIKKDKPRDVLDCDPRFLAVSDSAVRSVEETIANQDYPDFYCLYSKCHFNEYYKTLMPAFNFSHEEMHELYDYVGNESSRLRAPMPEDKLFHCVDSCLKYHSTKKKLEKKQQALIADNGRMLNRGNTVAPTAPSVQPAQANSNNSVPAPAASVVEVVSMPVKYYQVNIKSFGWFNIDILLKDIDGIKNSNLIVRIRGTYTENISLFLAIPSFKVFLEGGKLTTGENDYGFHEKDGTIPLPQRHVIHVFAAGEGNGKFIFGNAEFTAAAEQVITIELVETTKEAFDAAINKMGAAGIEISLDKTKNAGEIKDVEKALIELEDQKPRNCDCDCAGNGRVNFLAP